VGTITGISLPGCYVEMNTTFPVGTKVDLVLKSFGIRIEAPGTVRATYPFLGMGILLRGNRTSTTATTEATARRTVSNGISAPENSMKDAPGSADPRAFLDEITEFFQKKQLLSRDEFHPIAKRVRRS
jgi:hypothetical protein